MARFYGDLQGSRGEATRMGTPRSGIRSHVRGWDVGVAVYGDAQGDADVFDVYATGGSNRPSDRVHLGIVRVADAGDGRPHFYPSEHVRTIVTGGEEG